MRTAIILLFTCVFISVAETGHSQNAKISLNKNNSSLKEVLNEIENQTDYLFIYSNEVNTDKKVSVKTKNEAVSNVLNRVLKDSDIDFLMEGNHIILSHIEKQFNEKNNEKTETVQQQDKTVTGAITDSNGEAIIGANIIEKGTSNGTVTDYDGKFTLNVSNNAVLRVSYIGYLEQEVATQGLSSVNVVLEEDTKTLDEVVVVGYGTQKKVNLSGAVSSVKGDLLQNRTTTNTANMLTGNVAGVTLVQNSGQPGADAAALRVRGIGSLGNSEAMVVVDGVESSLENVNPNDIENISVLKDAAASSIYGVRAANGVILITTKRGSVGKTVVSYDSYIGWQKTSRLPKYLDSYNYGVLINEAYENDNLSPLYSDAELQKFKDGSDPDYYPNSDWLGELFSENGLFHNHHLSVQGGSEVAKYALSLGYHDKKGLMPNSNYEKYSVRSNIDIIINKRLNATFNLSAHRDQQIAPSSGVNNIMYNNFREPPVTPIQFQNGNYALYLSEHNSVAFARNSGTSNTYNNNFLGSASVNYKILKGLTLNGVASTTFNLRDQYDFLKKMDFYQAGETEPYIEKRSSVTNKDNKMLEVNLQTFIDYDRTFGNHNIKGLVGYSQIYNQFRILSALRRDLPSNNYIGEINAGDVNTQATEGNLVEYALRSTFGRVNYSYKDRYLFEANVRYDGSSRFPKNDRFGVFPSFSFAWRLSEEGFFNSSHINNFKLRASWGRLGNQEIGNYAFYNTYVFGEDYNFGNSLKPGISINPNMPNTSITWEKSDQINAGMDIGIFNGKLNFTGDFFVKDTKDILFRLPLPDIVGSTPPMQNAGVVRNIGAELQLDHNNQIQDFRYFATFNLSYIHNEITDLSHGDIPGRSVGDPIANIYGLVCEGIFNSQEEIDNHPKQIWGAKPGDLIYKDINNDNIVDDNDRKSLGTYFPKLNFGLRLGFEYKNFDFSALMQGAGMVNAIVRDEIGKPFVNGGKATEAHLDRWTPENHHASYPRASIQDSPKNWMPSTFWMQNSSYLKMRNLQIGYTIPDNLLNNYGLSRLRVYFSADNLFTLTGFDGVDPESAYNLGSLSGGSYYPISTSLSFGLNLSF